VQTQMTTDPTNPIPPASAVPAPVPTEAALVHKIRERHDLPGFRGVLVLSDKECCDLIAAASRAAVDQETAWLKKLCNEEGEAKERANGIIAQLQADRDKLDEELRRVRPIADAYERVCQSLGTTNDILGHVTAITKDRDKLAGELAELREKYRSREISNECVDAASQEREDNLKADLVRVRSALGTEETGDNLIEVCRAAHQAEQDLARYHRLSVGSNGAGEKTL
jgi:hypothetical protein